MLQTDRFSFPGSRRPKVGSSHQHSRKQTSATRPLIGGLFLLSLVILGSCTNSAIIISPLYNQLDRRMLGAFENMGEFEPSQIKKFKQLLANFHYWHRRSELPQYAKILDEMQRTVAVIGKTGKTDVKRWIEGSETFTQNMRQCHPINFSNDIIRSLTPDQVDTIVERRTARFANYRTRYFKESQEDRIKRRTANTVKWASRIGFDFTTEQEQLLLETHKQQISLRKEYFGLSDEWNKELYIIVREAQSTELDTRMADHLNRLWHLLEDAHPVEWRQNRELWSGFALKFVQSLTNDQRDYATQWIAKMGKTLDRISGEDVSVPILSLNKGCAGRLRQPLDGA